ECKFLSFLAHFDVIRLKVYFTRQPLEQSLNTGGYSAQKQRCQKSARTAQAEPPASAGLRLTGRRSRRSPAAFALPRRSRSRSPSARTRVMQQAPSSARDAGASALRDRWPHGAALVRRRAAG